LGAEPVYRQAEKEWKDFVEEFTSLLIEADPQIPPLPPKDVIHRIYRDVRVIFAALTTESMHFYLFLFLDKVQQ
jgi:hypothetical protein